jgi:hypothetical protein
MTEHSPPGGPTFETGIKPRVGRLQRLPCGCVSDDISWIRFCEAANTEYAEYRAMAARREPTPVKEDPA